MRLTTKYFGATLLQVAVIVTCEAAGEDVLSTRVDVTKNSVSSPFF